tara:strand:- start:1904 stop:2584 length:681 start_codon:yes stop_codon:yes gene_type:complete
MFIMPGSAIGFGAHQSAPSVLLSYVLSDTSSSNATDYSGSFDNKSIGTAASDRQVIICVYGPRSSAGARSASVLIGSTTATGLVTANSSGGEFVGIFAATITSGTTADIDVIFNSSMLGCAISIYTITGAATSASDTMTNVDTDPLAGSITVPAGGAVVTVAGASFRSTTNFNYTNATKDHDAVFDSDFHFSTARSTANGTFTITADADGNTSGDSMLAAVAFDVA